MSPGLPPAAILSDAAATAYHLYASRNLTARLFALSLGTGVGASVVDDAGRFAHAGQVSAAIGLVPREDSSAERQQRGHISKAGPSELRSLLVQAAWVCWRRGPRALREWADQLAARRGKRIAVVALARRLSRILFAIWRDETVFAESRRAA